MARFGLARGDQGRGQLKMKARPIRVQFGGRAQHLDRLFRAAQGQQQFAPHHQQGRVFRELVLEGGQYFLRPGVVLGQDERVGLGEVGLDGLFRFCRDNRDLAGRDRVLRLGRNKGAPRDKTPIR